MAKPHKYLVMSDSSPVATGSWEEELCESLRICHTVKAAYSLALSMAGITKPGKKYRKCLEEVKANGATQLRQEGGGAAATIVQVRIHGSVR
jgi:hypothetical protein